MAKKALVWGVLLVFCGCLAGCNTLYKGAKGAAEGAKEDMQDAQQVDDWMRKNLW